MRKDLHEANRRSWNAVIEAHNSHKADQGKFFRDGGSTLWPEELALLGDLSGKRVVHLQCNAGQDTLSLSKLGAEVVGVDISDTAIEFARKLSDDAAIPATFVRADVYDWLAEAKDGEPFDVVFASYGALCWLSDLGTWAKGVRSVLRPGGRLVNVEFHPMAMAFDDQLKLAYPYFGNDGPLTWDDGVTDYVGRSGDALAPSGFVEGVKEFENPHPVHEFQWTIGDILTAVIDAGLRIDAYREYPYSNGCRFYDDMVEIENKRQVLPEGTPSIAMMYALAASRPAG